MRADWTASGACISGSTAHPKGATSRTSGGDATTSTRRAEPHHHLVVERGSSCAPSVCDPLRRGQGRYRTHDSGCRHPGGWVPTASASTASLRRRPSPIGTCSESPKLAELAKAHPIQRLGTPEDVARAAVFLASEDAGWITGVILDVAAA